MRSGVPLTVTKVSRAGSDGPAPGRVETWAGAEAYGRSVGVPAGHLDGPEWPRGRMGACARYR